MGLIRSDLRSFIRLQVPEFNDTNVLSNNNMDIFLNIVTEKFIELTEAIITSTDFNAVASQQTYLISTQVTTYLRIHRVGLWWYDLSATYYRQLTSTTLEQLSEKEPTWLNRSAGTPLKYAIEGDVIYIHPKPSVGSAGDQDTFRMYHYKKSTNMTADTHYPFSGTTTEFPHLSSYTDVLVEGMRWKLLEAYGNQADAQKSELLFLAQCDSIKRKLKSREDIIAQVKATPHSSILVGGKYRGN